MILLVEALSNKYKECNIDNNQKHKEYGIFYGCYSILNINIRFGYQGSRYTDLVGTGVGKWTGG